MSIKRILFIVLLTVSPCVVPSPIPTSNDSTINLNPRIDFEYKEIFPGISRCSMLQEGVNGKELIGCICSMQGKFLTQFTSPAFDALDMKKLPPELVFLITLARAIKSRQDLDKVVVLGDLYIPAAHRGKGFAQQLVNNACQHVFNEGVTSAVLNPDPFEFEKGMQKSLLGSPDYVDKQQRLIKLYEKCGFTTDNNDSILLMYRNA